MTDPQPATGVDAVSDGRSSDQQQTESTFGFKWSRRDTYGSEAMQTEVRRWLFEKYFDNDPQRLDALLASLSPAPLSILDAGCGAGLSGSLLFGDRLRDHNYLGVDISEAVEVAKDRFAQAGLPGRFVRSDLNSIPDEEGPFDLIFSEGVLHHTDSVARAIAALADRLRPGAVFLFYVYLRKAPVREFTDDLIRAQLAGLSNDEAWEALRPLTKLGKALGELNATVQIDEDIPVLGIPKGTYDLQRLFYYKFCKAYYRPEYTLDEMEHINFDWFRPLNCHRHSPEEVRSFCEQAGLTVERLHVEDSGITVIARRP
jgi:arsenite methyltransferase